MKKYSLLIIAWEVYISHVADFIRNLKRTNPNVDISLLTGNPGANIIPEDIKANTTEVICIDYCTERIKNSFIRGRVDRYFFIRAFIRQSKKKYDIVDIHYAKPRLAFAMRWIKKLSDTIIITPWGSDVLRVEGERRIQQLTTVYSGASFVTVGADSPIGRQVIEKFSVEPNKLIPLGWGGEFFDYILDNSLVITTEDAKARFGLDGRYVITCGYNTQREQRHEAIIDAIDSVRDRLPDNLTLLFPFTYGRTEWSDKYTEAIKEKAKDLGFDVVSVEENLDMPDLLKLRMATDIFVHVQTTDAGSRCVMEYVACNKKVVHGSWVYYGYLEKYKPSCYFPVDRLENLGECVVKAYHTPIEPLPEEVMDIILKRGWKHKMELWNNFFESLV